MGGAMVKLFYAVLNLTIAGSITAFTVILAKVIFKNKIKKSILVLLWIIAFMRFSIPFSISSPTSVLNFINKDSTQTIIGGVDIVHNFTINTKTNSKIDLASNNMELSLKPNSIKSGNKTNGKMAPVNNKGHISVITTISIIWIAGMLVLLLSGITAYLAVYLKTEKSDKEQIELISASKRLLKIKRKINYHTSTKVSSPCVLGLVFPKIVFPKDNNLFDENILKYIIMHELVHVKKSHNIIKIFSFIVLCIQWYNPLIWISFIMLQNDLESSCDEKVIAVLGEDIKKEYASSLYDFAVKKHNLIKFGFASFGETNTKRRVADILNYKKTTAITSAIAILITSGVFAGCATNPFSKGPFNNSKIVFKNYDGLWISSLNEGKAKLLVKGSGIMQPMFSPDGSSVIFKQKDNLYLCNVSTYKVQLLMKKVLSYCFNNNGEVYASSVKDGIVLINSETLKSSAVVKPYENTNYLNISKSPDDKYLSYEKDVISASDYKTYGIYLYDTLSKNEKLIVKSTTNSDITLSVNPTGGKWSPDSKKLFVWLGFHAGSLSTDGVPSGIYDIVSGKLIRFNDKYGFALRYDENVAFSGNDTLAMVSGGDRVLWSRPLKKLNIINYKHGIEYKTISIADAAPMTPAFSNEGADSKLVFTESPVSKDEITLSQKEYNNYLNKRQIYMLNNNKITQLTNDSAYRSVFPVFLANNKYILFVRVNAKGQYSLWTMKSDGSDKHFIAEGVLQNKDYDDLTDEFFYGRENWGDCYSIYDDTVN